MANLLQGMGYSQPVTGFINTAIRYTENQSELARREQMTNILKNKAEAEAKQAERDNEWLDVTEVLKKAQETGHGGAINLAIQQQMNLGLHKEVTGPDETPRTFMRRIDVAGGLDAIGSDAKLQPAILADRENWLTAQIDALDKKKEDPKFAQQYSEFLAERRMVRNKLYGLDEDKEGAGFTLGEGQKRFDASGKEIAAGAPSTTGGTDPAVVKTFEAAHPELVSKRGTTEYGRALEAFIKSGERPYSTFVGLTPDGKQAITFDSRKGTVGLQPLPFEGDIQPKVKPTIPTEQTTAFQQIGTLKEALAQVTDKYEDSFVGPIAGPTGKLQDNWGIMPDAKRAEFRALTANLYNTIIYLRSGKQINEEEAKRLLDELPTMNVSPVGFQAKLKKFTWELNSIERGRMRQLGGAGYRNVGASQGAGPTVVETRTLGDGTTWDKYSDGTFKQR